MDKFTIFAEEQKLDQEKLVKEVEALWKNSSKKFLPIPKGKSHYALAKNAEYKDRNLEQAEFFYRKAIENGDRIESAIKDLASLLNQKGQTKQACALLKANRRFFMKSRQKFKNLYNTLKKQLKSSENSKNRSLKISGLSPNCSESSIASLFTDPIRIQSFEFGTESALSGSYSFTYYCIIRFNSHSSARKTLFGFNQWKNYKIEWVSVDGQVTGDAYYTKIKLQEYRKENPTFDYTLFDRDPCGYIFCLPIEEPLRQTIENKSFCKEKIAEKLLGKKLFSTIFQEILV